MPNLDIRAAQIYLRYLGSSTGGVDGVAGPATRGAVLAFQTQNGMLQSGMIDDALIAALRKSLGL